MKIPSVSFENSAGEEIVGTLHTPESDTTDAIIMGHCFTCSRHTSILRDISTALTEQKGIAAFRFDFSGNGQSQGNFSETTYTKHIYDMIAASEFLRSRGYRRFGLAGHSMGASIAVLSGKGIVDVVGICGLAGRLAQTSRTSIFSRNQLQQLDKTGRLGFTSRGRELELNRSFFEDAKRYDVPTVVRQLTTPLLIVHGEKDEIVPVTEAHAAAGLNPHVTLEILPDADHMFMNPDHRHLICERVCKWFAERFLQKEV